MPPTSLIKILIILSFTGACACFGLGTWVKENTPLTPFAPDFVLLKVGVFSNGGSLKVLKDANQLKEACKTTAVKAWITHRLSKGERLSADAGERLAKEIESLLNGTCVRQVELDIDPLPEAVDWFVKFATSLKAGLGEISLRFAVLAEFSRESFEKLLVSADGLDWMVYDTGAKLPEDYAHLFSSALLRIDELAGKYPSKFFIVGLPAYYDKTKRHTAKAENLQVVLKSLSTFKPKHPKAWCERKLDFAVYAGWTMTAEDKALSQLVRAWRENLCKNG